MRRFLALAILLAACAGPRSVVERAIEAQGGKEAMQAIRSAHLDSEGTFAGQPFTAVTNLRRPGDWRWDLESPQGRLSQWVLRAGADVYVSHLGTTVKKRGDTRRSSITHAYSSMATLLPDLMLAQGVGLRKAEPVLVDGLHHPAVTVFFEGAEPVLFAFHPDSGRIRYLRFEYFDDALLVRQTFTAKVGDWKEVGGIQVAHRMEASVGGFRMVEETQNVFWNREPSAMLARPEADPPLPVRLKREAETRYAHYVHVGSPDTVAVAVTKVASWIEENGGQPAGPVTLVFEEPIDYADPSRSETVIHAPCKMEPVPEAGEIRLRNREPFTMAYVSYTGTFAGAFQQFGTVWEWCNANGYRKNGHRRITIASLDEKTGAVKADVGFPVRRKRVSVLPG